MKDQKGKQTGREFLVIRKDIGGEKGTWEPFENLLHCKKALKSFYNKHPELPYPNCLAQNEDEEFDPANNKSGNKGMKQNEEAFAFRQDKKQRGRPKQIKQQPIIQAQPISQARSLPVQNRPMNQPKSPGPQHMNGKTKNFQEEKTPSQNSVIRVQGLFADSITDQIIFHIYKNGQHFYQNRKWVMEYCKNQLIDFYQRCIRFQEK